MFECAVMVHSPVKYLEMGVSTSQNRLTWRNKDTTGDVLSTFNIRIRAYFTFQGASDSKPKGQVVKNT